MVDFDNSKPDPLPDLSEESAPSSPDVDGEPLADQPQVQKRRGGRKPIYATSEERKQRNRQAQAAFRERRTEYIKQLETTIRRHEDKLQTLQSSQRTSADDCLMLRYKNSLLERILLEKGVDVQAELRARMGSPNLPPIRIPPVDVSPPQPVQRVSVSKGHRPRRYITHPTPKIDTTPNLTPQLTDGVIPNPSPRSNPPPTASHFSSPATVATRSPNFFPQAGSVTSPSLGPLTHPQQRHSQAPLRPNLPMQPPQRPPMSASYASSSGISSSSPAGSGHPAGSSNPPTSAGAAKADYYSNPFQNHLDQLEREYDAAADMADDQDVQSPQAPPGAYSQHFAQSTDGQPSSQGARGMAPLPEHNANAQYQQATPPHAPHLDVASNGVGNYPNINTFFDPYDPMLDADPFGLSASMHFPTQFSYDAR